MASSKKRSPNRDRFEAAIEAALDRCAVGANAAPFDAIGVAFSGGADSTLLLHTTAALSVRRGLRIVCLHVHHGLSKNADAWADHCARAAASLGVEFRSVRVAVKRRGGESLEAVARDARYLALENTCRQAGVQVLLTGHHADDQAETVLLNLVRGTGLAGLAGMATERRLGGTTLLRPFLAVRAAEIRTTLEARGIGWIEDEANRDLRFRRNALRHQVLPILGTIAPDAIDRIASTARWVSQAQLLLEERGVEDLAALNADASGFEAAPFRTLTPLRAANALRCWFRRYRSQAPGAQGLEEMMDRFHGSRARVVSELCVQGTLWRLVDGRFSVCEGDGVAHPVPLPHAAPAARVWLWQGESVLELPEWKGRIIIAPVAQGGPSARWLRSTPLLIRARHGAERLRLSFDRPSRTLKNLYQENGIPSREREALPLVLAGEQLVFAAGLGSDCRMHGKPGEEQISLHWERQSNR